MHALIDVHCVRSDGMQEEKEERSSPSRPSFIPCLLTLAAEWHPSDSMLQEALVRAHAADTAAAVTGGSHCAGYQLGGRWGHDVPACLFSGAVFSSDWLGGLEGWSQEAVKDARDACTRMLKARRQVRRRRREREHGEEKKVEDRSGGERMEQEATLSNRIYERRWLFVSTFTLQAYE